MSGKDDQQSAKARRAALEKQLASKAKPESKKSAKPEKASKTPKAAKADKTPKTKAEKAPKPPRQGMGKVKKIAIGVGALLFLVSGYLGIRYMSAGGEYEHELVHLLPQEAIMVIVIDDAGKVIPEIDENFEGIYKGRHGIRHLEASPFWREGPNISFANFHRETLSAGLRKMRSTAESLPGDFSFEKDMLAGQLTLAMLPHPSGEGTDKLILTRVSQDFAKLFEFRDFATSSLTSWATTNEDASQTLEEDEGFLVITPKSGGEKVFLGLFDDVLAIAWDKSLLTSVASRFDSGEEGGFAANELMSDANKALDDSDIIGEGVFKAYANLEALRKYQGPDKEDPKGRASIDTYFSLSPQVMQMSAEIMPTISNVLDHSIDTRLYDMAAWKMRVTPKEGLLIDQFLIASDKKIDDFPLVQAAMATPARDMGFLKLLPQGTWKIATMRQPLSEVRKATKPPGEDNASAIYSFMKALGKQGKEPDSIGMAMLPGLFSPLNANDKRPDNAKRPPKVVSKLPFPPFALFMHWEGVDFEQVKSLLDEVVTEVVAESKDPNKPAERTLTRVIEKSIHGTKYVEIFNGPKQNEGTVGWLNNIAAVAIDDYLFFVYAGLDGRIPSDVSGRTGVNTAVEYIVGCKKGIEGRISMASANPKVWGSGDNKHNALVYLASKGVKSFASTTNLADTFAEAKFSGGVPDDKSASEFRKEIAKEMGLDIADAKVTEEYRRRIAEWKKGRPAYVLKTRKNIDALGVVKDFSATTKTTPTLMHTRFLIRLGR